MGQPCARSTGFLRRWWPRVRSGSAGVTQSASVGGLIVASLLIAAGIVPLAPKVGTAVADLYRCSLGAPAGDCVSPAGRELTQVDVRPDPDTPAGLLRPWASDVYLATIAAPAQHGPPWPANSGRGGTWRTTIGSAPTPRDWCAAERDTTRTALGPNRETYCVDGDGSVSHCTKSRAHDWLRGGWTVDLCPTPGVQLADLACTADGAHAGDLVCTLGAGLDDSGRYLHCRVDPARAGWATCTDADHDRDASIPGGTPLACATIADPTGSTPCLGANGTLYNCTTRVRQFDCIQAGRNIDPRTDSLSDCTEVPAGVGPGLGGTAVQCTWTGVGYGCAPAGSGITGGCPAHTTTVQCSVSPADGVYNSCQDLGGLVTKNAVLCAARDAADGCTDQVVLPLLAVDVDHVTDLAGTDVALSTDAVRSGTLTSPYSGQEIPYEVQAAWCRANAATCRQHADAGTAELEGELAGMLERLGLCTGPQECRNPEASPLGRKLLLTPGQRRVAVDLAVTGGLTLALWGLNTLQFTVAASSPKWGGLVGAVIFSLMFFLNKMKDRALNRVDPGGAAVDQRALVQGARAWMAPLNGVIGLIVGQGEDGDNTANRVFALARQTADLENQLDHL